MVTQEFLCLGRAILVNFQVLQVLPSALFSFCANCLRLVPTAAHPLHMEGQFWAGGPDLVGTSASPHCCAPQEDGRGPTGKLHGAQAVLWSPIQGINTIFCFLDAAASWPCVHIQFAHFSSALSCVNLLKRLSLKGRTNRAVNRRLCRLWRGRSPLLPCSRACGPGSTHTMLSASPPLPQQAFAEL